MKRYFLVAKEVGALTRMLCAKLEADHAKQSAAGACSACCRRGAQAARRSRRASASRAGACDHRAPSVLDNPVNRAPICLQIADERDLDVHPDAFGEAARRAAAHYARRGAHDPKRARRFSTSATSQRHPGAALRLMNEAGVLGRFVPEFGRIVAQMQFNMYHHFTVDEHTLHAVDAISRDRERPPRRSASAGDRDLSEDHQSPRALSGHAAARYRQGRRRSADRRREIRARRVRAPRAAARRGGSGRLAGGQPSCDERHGAEARHRRSAHGGAIFRRSSARSSACGCCWC